MQSADELIKKAEELRTVLSGSNDTEILAQADEMLLFLNRLNDLFQNNKNFKMELLSIKDIIQGLESDPDVTLQDQYIRTRLLNLFIKLATR
jgi:hypothetical protein